MLTYDLEKRGNHTLYEYLYFCIKEDILTGRIKAGEKLPSKREMARNHNIAVITVENAYEQLVVEGYITAKEKSGFYVNSGVQSEKRAYTLKDEFLNQGISGDMDLVEQREWIVDFSSNRMPGKLFPFATWTKLMRRVINDRVDSFWEKPEAEGIKDLREAIADYLKRAKGLCIPSPRIIVGPGTEYLHHIILQLIGHNRLVAVEDPGYKKVGKLYESNGMKCLHIPVDQYGLKVEALFESNASLVHISPSHHFPTGCVMSMERRYQLLDWAEKQNAYIIEDDYDSEFRFNGRPIPTLAELDEYHVIYMNTFTKTLTPSIRIAYMVLPDNLAHKFSEKLNFYSGAISSFEQYTLAAFMKEGYYERNINRMKNYYRQQRNRILSAFTEARLNKDVQIQEDKAGLHFILYIEKLTDDAKFIQYLEAHGIAIAPVSKFCYHKSENFAHKFIINYTDVAEDKLMYALDFMDLAIQEQKST